MSDKFFVGLDITGFKDNGKRKPISRVTLLVDDENSYTAGDDTGMELSASCAHATQAMVNNILAQVKGYQYQAYSADAANIDPAAELGDGATVGGVYSVISRMDDDGSGYPGLSAPGEEELEDEYPSTGPMTQEFTRQLAETRSQITKTAEQIRLEVANEVQGLSASIDIQLDSISSQITGLEGDVSTLTQTANSLQSQITSTNGQVSTINQTVNSITTRVTGLEGDYSSLEQYVDSLTLSVSNGSTSSTISLKAGTATISSQNITFSGFVTFTGLSGGTTTINGGCIKTGTISASRLDLSNYSTTSEMESEIEASISAFEDGLALSVTNGSESSTIKLMAGTTTISSQSITFSGMVTFTDLSTAGSTIINGANITTGTISASRLNLTGAISWSDLTSSVQNDIDSAYSLASTASSTASNAATTASTAYTKATNAANTVNSWTYSGTTYIDGTKLMTGTVTATKLQGGTVGIINSSGSQIGYMSVGSSTSTGLQLVSGGNLYFASASCHIGLSGSDIAVGCSYFYPDGAAAYLGYSTKGMWQAVYSYTATVQTSDRNLKHDIEDLPDKYLYCLLSLKPRRYKMNNGTSDRYHVGFIAQEVEEAMELYDISSLEFAGFIKDVDTEGKEIYMLRYEEFMAIHTLAVQRIYQRLEAAGL